MSENKICTICGGYKSIALAEIAVSTAAAGTTGSVIFCPGHKTTDADLSGHFPIYGETGLEQLYTPAVSSIFPPNFDAFWQIVQAVAEEDVTYHDANDYMLHCPYCYTCTNNFIDPFPHDKECIVVKARALMEWRNAQPKISIQVRDDFPLRAADIAREIEEKIKAIDGEVPRD